MEATKLLTMRIPESLRDRFVALCKQNDTSASRELREFMRRYIREVEKQCDS